MTSENTRKTTMQEKWICTCMLDPKYCKDYSQKLSTVIFHKVSNISSVNFTKSCDNSLHIAYISLTDGTIVANITKLGKPIEIMRIEGLKCTSLPELMITLELNGYLYDSPDISAYDI